MVDREWLWGALGGHYKIGIISKSLFLCFLDRIPIFLFEMYAFSCLLLLICHLFGTMGLKNMSGTMSKGFFYSFPFIGSLARCRQWCWKGHKIPIIDPSVHLRNAQSGASVTYKGVSVLKVDVVQTFYYQIPFTSGLVSHFISWELVLLTYSLVNIIFILVDILGDWGLVWSYW